MGRRACFGGCLVLGAVAMGTVMLAGTAGTSFSVGAPAPLGTSRGGDLRGHLRATGTGPGMTQPASGGLGTTAAALCGALAAAACAVRCLAALTRRAAAEHHTEQESAATGRRSLLATVAAVSAVTPAAAALAAPVDVPDRINQDPYELIGLSNSEDSKEDKKEFYMKKKYRADTYQLLKHMKISGSLDKGTPNMEKWNKRIKEEMNDWVALYRRQDLVVGRQSYYSLYSAVNTLASHFTSYGPKFPFPSKRRARFYELINTTEKYLEKGK
eukprot:CAMPEP_0115294056 /NCGR_PEP_ID=MMETSP0270-20121206/65988_1 /TAXON_ID=71861 /ORGANISM="Scrippsiella trochoidea, Strain CCMP3099" /LENGTH=270 /DNA_ID=CAMNT_0002711575 /DNA_START=116 /DNA_END=928 /DNA_ORIENTATION=+